MMLALYVGVGVACITSREALVLDPNADAAAPLRRDDADEIPCDARRVLETICQQCHTRPPANGAPFPLQTRSDVLASYGGMVLRDLMIEQLTARRMPLAPVTIADDERRTLLAWLRAGAPADPPSACARDAAVDSEAGGDQ
ncbi:MAG: hypothetical protein KIT84_04990 [Labilithrix sp.]|nr:hypothetical protein [Labilithrix sp.]MCW5810343.1 hypothetical protein [Labilithrix sp.]